MMKDHDEIMEHCDKIGIARNAILDELSRRYKAQDKSVAPLIPEMEHHWYKPQKNYFSGGGIMDCPVCKTGKLKYSRAGYNGHVHGRCSTNGCVAWME
jgi:hypothetical protein